MPSYAKLTRDHKTPLCTLGTLIISGKVYYTLERPWLDNTPEISCIPTGFYHCRYKSRSNNGKLTDVYEVLDVPDRKGVLIHTGNTVADSHGCILLAFGRDIESGKIINSRVGMADFIETAGNTFELLIEDLA